MMTNALGHTVWAFPDGELPPRGDDNSLIEGHESLIILNTGEKDAQVSIDVYFTDAEPEEGLPVTVSARSVRCFRLDKPIDEREFRIPPGQYALVLRSNVPVVAQIGRADVRQPNLAYYTILGYGCR